MSAPTGYCWPQSASAGEVITLHLGAEAPLDATVTITRDGVRPELVWSADAVRLEARSIPDDAPEHGCGWEATLTVTVDDSWRTGLYLVRLGDAAPTAWFVVRSSSPTPGAPLLKLASNTWNAYNDFGGRNLYSGAVRMSTHRPLVPGFLAKADGPGSRVTDDLGDFLVFAVEGDLSLWHGMSGWANQERRFVIWAESAGIDLDYAIDSDFDHADRAAALLAGRSLVLSVGHDEYWTWSMRDHIEGFVAAGGNVAFLSGNTAYWQVRLEDDDTEMVAYKHLFRQDPVMGTAHERLVTSMWSDPIIGRPESEMTGVTFTRGGYHGIHLSVPDGTRGYEVQRPDHWLLDRTDLRRGQVFGSEHRIVGYECDGTELTVEHGVLTATGTGGTPDGFTVVATAPATMFDKHTTPTPIEPDREYELEFHAQRLLGGDDDDRLAQLRHGYAVLGTWTHESGGTVVTTGCTEWAYGLYDPTVATITRTILRRLGNVTGRPANATIANLSAVFASIDALCADLTEEQWKAPTGCPGWSVQDNVAHIIDFEATALGWPKPFHAPADGDHIRNELGRANELGVDARRSMTGAEVLAEFRTTVEARLLQLWAILPDDLSTPADTPAGPATLADQLRMRVMDCWSHEQDIRRALGLPGHVTGPVADESIGYFEVFLPYLIGKAAKSPEGTVARLVIGERTVQIAVTGGRAAVVDPGAAEPTVTISMPTTTFAAHIGGRTDAPDDVDIVGDTTTGAAIVAALPFLP